MRDGAAVPAMAMGGGRLHLGTILQTPNTSTQPTGSKDSQIWPFSASSSQTLLD